MRVSQWKVTSARVFWQKYDIHPLLSVFTNRVLFFAGGLEVPWDGLSLCWRLEIYGQSWWFAPHDDGCCHSRGCWRKPQPGWHQYNTQLGCRKSLGNNSHTFYSLGNQVIGEHVRMLIPSFFFGGWFILQKIHVRTPCPCRWRDFTDRPNAAMEEASPAIWMWREGVGWVLTHSCMCIWNILCIIIYKYVYIWCSVGHPPSPPPPMGMGGQYRLVLLVPPPPVACGGGMVLLVPPPLWPVVVVWFFWSPPPPVACGGGMLVCWYVGMLVCWYVCMYVRMECKVR